MATHDYNIANQGFPAFRADLNDALAAIVSNNSNATAPATTFAHQWWMDTSANPSILKVRNADNDAWITLGTFNQSTDTFTPAGVTSDKIEEGNSKVEVVDSGTGYIVFEVDGAEVARFNPDQLVTKAGTVSAPAIAPTGDLNTGIYFPAADNIGFATNGVIRGRWTTDGLCFGSDTAAANALDDYEEGTWTPNDNSGAGLTFTNPKGYYTKIGGLVTCSFSLLFPSTANGNSVQIGNLPFTVGSINSVDNGGPSGGVGYTSAAFVPQLHVQTGSTNLNLYNLINPVTNANMSTIDLRGTFCYRV